MATLDGRSTNVQGARELAVKPTTYMSKPPGALALPPPLAAPTDAPLGSRGERGRGPAIRGARRGETAGGSRLGPGGKCKGRLPIGCGRRSGTGSRFRIELTYVKRQAVDQQGGWAAEQQSSRAAYKPSPHRRKLSDASAKHMHVFTRARTLGGDS